MRTEEKGSRLVLTARAIASPAASEQYYEYSAPMCGQISVSAGPLHLLILSEPPRSTPAPSSPEVRPGGAVSSGASPSRSPAAGTAVLLGCPGTG